MCILCVYMFFLKVTQTTPALRKRYTKSFAQTLEISLDSPNCPIDGTFVSRRKPTGNPIWAILEMVALHIIQIRPAEYGKPTVLGGPHFEVMSLVNPRLLVGIRCHAILTIPRDAISCRHVFAGEAHGQEARLANLGFPPSMAYGKLIPPTLPSVKLT